jgi:predicted house-cleaning noncanonical NTP pyrophosphatase (MazG superfamily)
VTRKVCDKLVRDRIPEIIRQAESSCGIEVFSKDSASRRVPSS